jgi:riboflavin kinase/FMN adenylyltransferase
MFAHARGRIEAYLIGLPDHDLYGRMLTLRFLQRLRPQQKFESIDALLQQMQQDTEQAAKIAANQGAIADRGNL